MKIENELEETEQDEEEFVEKTQQFNKIEKPMVRATDLDGYSKEFERLKQLQKLRKLISDGVGRISILVKTGRSSSIEIFVGDEELEATILNKLDTEISSFKKQFKDWGIEV